MIIHHIGFDKFKFDIEEIVLFVDCVLAGLLLSYFIPPSARIVTMLEEGLVTTHEGFHLALHIGIHTSDFCTDIVSDEVGVMGDESRFPNIC